MRPKKPAGKAPGSGSIREATQRIIFRSFSWDANHLARHFVTRDLRCRRGPSPRGGLISRPWRCRRQRFTWPTW